MGVCNAVRMTLLSHDCNYDYDATVYVYFDIVLGNGGQIVLC